MKVIILNGAPQVGKGTFVELLRECTNRKVISRSSINWVKEKAISLGWDGVKDKKGRQFLADIKDACTEYGDIPFRKITERIEIYQSHEQHHPVYFCIDIREPAEILKMSEWCLMKNIPCYAIWIRSIEAEQKAVDAGFNSDADMQYRNYQYYYHTIWNDQTKEVFKDRIKFLIESI